MKKLYYNGDIITMENEQDHPQALLVEDGVIAAVGDYEALKAQLGDGEAVDLAGKTLMPSFIDPHGHFEMASVQYAVKVDLESAECFDDIVTLLKNFIAEKNIPAGTPVTGYAYDHNYLKEGTHPDKKVLDRASDVHPIVISHTSGHIGSANSLALERAGITADTPDPQGGMIDRYPGTTEPTGYLEEAAIMMATGANAPVIEDPVALIADIQELYASYGVTTVQDGATSGEGLATIRKAGDDGRLYLDVVTYPMPMGLNGKDELTPVMENNNDIVGTYKNHVKIGGYKILLDGTPQGKSAWMSEPYEGEETYCGYPWLEHEVVHQYVRRAIDDNQQLLTHCNGDAASQELLDVYEEELAKSDNPNKDNLRPVMIHCQTVRDDQLDRMVPLKMIPSIFVAHTYYWGDVHLKNFGPKRGPRVSPSKSALDRGLVYNFHTDTPVRLPKMLHTVWAAANRITKSGVEIGPEQRISVYDALKGITINAAYAYFEEDSKGSLKEGKRADLVILDQNPLKVDKMALKDIDVLETIKDGVTIYKK